MCVCALCVSYRMEMRALLFLIVFSVTVWFGCALVCDGVWCVCACACLLLCCLRDLFSILFEYVCAFCLACIV